MDIDIIGMLTDPAAWLSLVTLALLEIVLGIDNLVIVAILAGKLPPKQQPRARRLGLSVALITRIMLLSLAFFIAQMAKPLFSIAQYSFSIRDLLLIAGGLFLLVKGTLEIHHTIEDDDSGPEVKPKVQAVFGLVIAQIAVMDIVFSFDSVMTAIGVAEHLPIMILAIVISMAVMIWAINGISDFIARHPTVKMLALSYILLIGIALIGEGFQFHIPKGYLYFAMAFSFGVELLNMAGRRRAARRLIGKTLD